MTILPLQRTSYSILPTEESTEVHILDRLQELPERALKMALEFMGCENTAKLSILSIRHRVFTVIPSRPSFNPVKFIRNRRLYFALPESERVGRVKASLKPGNYEALKKKYILEKQKLRRLGTEHTLPFRKKTSIEFKKYTLGNEIYELKQDLRVQRRRAKFLNDRFDIDHKENIALSVALSGGYFLFINYPEEYQRIQKRIEVAEFSLSENNRQIELLDSMLDSHQKCNEWTRAIRKLQS